MDEYRTSFDQFLAEEVEKYRDVAFPVRTGRLRQMLVRHLSCGKLHPNPEDEFCVPGIGPSYSIISEYMDTFLRARAHGPEYCEEPVIVERMHPDGYMILNGHHRWAAAKRLGYRTIRVKIVNLTQASDLMKMLKRAKYTRRVTLDLDEVVLRSEHDADTEKPLPFPYSRLYRERLRRGIPALFDYLDSHGYDVWVYSSQYYSFEYLFLLFKHYHARVSFVVTGAKRKTRLGNDLVRRIRKIVADRYTSTVSIDNEMVLRVAPGTKSHQEYPLAGGKPWAEAVIDIMEAIEQGREDEKH